MEVPFIQLLAQRAKNKMRINYIKLKSLISDYLIQQGISIADSQITATVLLEGTIRGYINHGIRRLLQIKEGFENATICTNNLYQILRENDSTAVIDACNYLGYPVGDFAMRLAIQKAKRTGIGLIGTLNASHLGILSYYSELASNDACLGIVMSTSSPAVVLKGGKIKTLGTNPISYSVPFAPKKFTADFSTSKVARGTIIQYHKENRLIPKDWAVDQDGKCTDNPENALKGGIQTIDGDIKGSLLSLLISIMAGHMIGGEINPNVTGTRYMNERSNKGDLFIAIDISSLTSLNRFQDQTIKLCEFISNQKISFRVPGHGSYKRRKNAMNQGIIVDKDLMDILR